MFRRLLSILLFSQTLLLVSYADTNGIWTYAEDIESGVFGADENTPGSNYTFNDIVYFNENIFSQAQISAQGDITTQSSMVAGDFIDVEDSNYFLKPSGVSNLYGIEANRYFSSDGDTNYYLDPSGDSRVNNLEVVDTLRVDNIIFGDGVIVGSGPSGSPAPPASGPGNPPVCDGGKYLQWDGANWQCKSPIENYIVYYYEPVETVAQECIDPLNPTLEDNLPDTTAKRLRFTNTCGNRYCKSEGNEFGGRVVEISSSGEAEIQCQNKQ